MWVDRLELQTAMSDVQVQPESSPSRLWVWTLSMLLFHSPTEVYENQCTVSLNIYQTFEFNRKN